MLHPVGPLPASVYWRRRLLALAVALVVLLLIWLVASPGGSGSSPDRAAGQTGTATAGDNPTTPTTPTDPSATSLPSETLAATPPAHDPGRRGGGTNPTTSGSSPIDGSAGTAPATPTACPDSALKVTIEAAHPEYEVGAQPQITLSVQNVSGTACTRDLGASQQEVMLYDGSTRLWSSNDCYPGGGQDVETINAGGRDRYSVTWSGLSSQPKCAGTRTRVGPGTYKLIGRVGSLQSDPATLTLHTPGS